MANLTTTEKLRMAADTYHHNEAVAEAQGIITQCEVVALKGGYTHEVDVVDKEWQTVWNYLISSDHQLILQDMGRDGDTRVLRISWGG